MRRYENVMKNQGFTLIEILVVVSIIGLISSVALANFQGAKSKANIAAGQQFHSSAEHILGADEIGKWTFDEGSGSVAYDSSGNSLTGTIVGATYVTDGILGSALSFDGDSYVEGINFPHPGESRSMTISAWLRPTNIAANNSLFRVGDASCTLYQIAVSGGQAWSIEPFNGDLTDTNQSQNALAGALLSITGDDGTNVLDGGFPVSDERIISNNIWQNFAFVFDDTRIETYVNGILKGSAITTSDTSCVSQVWTIASTGASAAVGTGYQGIMDDVQIFGVALTASEVGKIYALGQPTHKNVLVDNQIISR